ncbi:hypothetical protein BDY21DRAFT_372886 [Lineolata rhizophorae]|uniref:DUF3074 domain-containing protein n=1 Tax=Lineolata rhizophorae TaxID=578093 RepID=A0A6A6NVY9_9PEZI|nr:hypothetical protein BDY21DRAFT_372886 [Lineolata rhizophorae]
MSKLHEALQTLRPKNFADIPIDDLSDFLRNVFRDAELISNSVPPPPGGDDFLHSTRAVLKPNGARSAAEMIASSVRPPPPDPEQAAFQEAWGKPVKVNAKDNPLGISVYKMAGHDRHGAWFARRSVHEGMGFGKWKKAMKREFAESLAVQGGPGEGSVRGIGGDRRLERIDVDGVGRLEVYQLSAQFPGPTAPREFITLLLTTDTGLSDSSKPHVDDARVPDGIPRHYMVVSIPVEHPDAPPRQGLIRGSYESVELIREVPLAPSKSQSTSDLSKLRRDSSRGRQRGNTIGFAESRGPSAKGERVDLEQDGPAVDADDPELNPVDWIMITRSDPGGGIPRFMVERGTPSSILADAGKFLDWACVKEDIASEDEDLGVQEAAQELARRSMEEESKQALAEKKAEAKPQPDLREQGGMIDSLTAAVEAGIQNYAPSSVQDRLPGLTRARSRSESSSTETSSLDSFASAEPFTTAPDGSSSVGSMLEKRGAPSPSGDSLSMTSLTPESSEAVANAQQRNRHQRELAKLTQKKAQLDAQIAKSRERQAARSVELVDKEDRDTTKLRERHARELAKQEDKYKRELAKLEAKRRKEDEKGAARMRKEAQRDALSRAQLERDEWKRRAEILREENEGLRIQVEELQRENTTLVARMGKSEAGQKELSRLRQELMNRSRQGSFKQQV